MVTNSYPQNFISRPSIRALEPPYYLTAGLGFRVFWEKGKISAVRQCRRLCILSRISSHSPRALLLPDYLCSEIPRRFHLQAGNLFYLELSTYPQTSVSYLSHGLSTWSSAPRADSSSPRIRFRPHLSLGLPPLRCAPTPLGFHPDPSCYLPKASGPSLYPSPTTTLH